MRALPLALAMVHADGVVRLDGALNEPVWLRADSIVTFRQLDPREGEPATQRTVIRVLTSSAGIYVGAWLDQPPGSIVRAHVRRDDSVDEDDYIAIMFDPQRDRRSGVVFATNPNGLLFDAEVVGAEDLNEDWNGVWDVRTAVHAGGWTAEFFIPWQNFRYAADATGFGLNVERLMRRANEKVLWRGWLRQQGLVFQEDEGLLVLPEPPPRRGGSAELRPYVAATGNLATRVTDSTGAWVPIADGGASVKVGGDAKIGVTPRLTLDLTANTDFAQAEVDRQVVNLSRFPVFFPEQRQFFLESSGIFNFGQVERTSLFNSRRIGLDSNGAVVPIVAGARLSGRAGAQRLGLLLVRTGGSEDALDAVARVKRDAFERGYVGAMAIHQRVAGQDRLSGGLDFEFPLLLHGKNLVPSGFIALTHNGNGAPTASAWRFFLDYPNDHADHFLAFSRIEGGFDPALGFVRQSGVQRQTGRLEFDPRPRIRGVRRLVFQPIEFDITEDLHGALDNASYQVIPLGVEFESGADAEISFQHDDDVPRDSFEIFPGSEIPPGRYGWNRASAEFSSSPAHRFGFSLGGSVGGFYSGRGQELEYSMMARLEPHVIASVGGSWQWIQFAGSRFTAQEHRVRLDYARSPRLNTTVFVQWDNESERLAVNARLHWIPRPGADAYLVWNSAWPTALAGGIPWRRPQRGGLVAKLAWYFRP